jgi:hypothetical protein
MSLSHAIEATPIFKSPSLPQLLNYYKAYFPEFTISLSPSNPSEPRYALIYTEPKPSISIYIQQGAEQCTRGSCVVVLDSGEALLALYERLKREEGIEKMDTLGWNQAPTGIFPGSGDGTRRIGTIGPLKDTSWGKRQFDMIDPHGNLIVFSVCLRAEY